MGVPAKRMRTPNKVWLSDSDKALLAFPDHKKGEKATGQCFFRNRSGNHRWTECP